MKTLDLQIYMARLPDDALAAVPDLARWFTDSGADRLGHWLINDGYHAEQSRRWRNAQPEFTPEEAEPLLLKPSAWSNHDVAQALKCLTSASYSTADAALGRLTDDLVKVVVALAMSRLEAHP